MAVIGFGWFAGLLSKLPARTKRTIFIASLYTDCVAKSHRKPVELGELNTALALASNPEALKLPAVLHKVLWESRAADVSAVLTAVGATVPEEKERVSRGLVARTPKWLAYANSEEMVRDIQRLFSILGKT